ncbi:MAG: hypothetical protein KZQ98_19515 [Candidatus Thiodiazotropha sp. (ex Lucinoma borealis)]|nr:hypothetical protein [Candidatus Thiodiazotropha sp. (ex Lucinoma borealis)]
MESQLANSQTGDKPPRLWVERLSIFRNIKPVDVVRNVKLRRGINIVWAHEPHNSDKVSGLRATGHGVGKTSFCLLLRYCLGDQTKSIDTLRDELQSEFPDGGIGAVIHIDGRVFSVFRHFAPYREGFAAETPHIDSLFTYDDRIPYKEFEAQLSESMLSRLEPKMIPDTDQKFQWVHMLAWLTRDQGTRFANYFHWREGEGAGLQRARQDPPLLMRAALGLLEHNETELLHKISALEQKIEEAKDEIAKLEIEPTIIRRRIASNLRAWLGVEESTPLMSDDLFTESVESGLKTKVEQANQVISQAESQLEDAENRLTELRDALYQKQKQQELCENDARWKEAALKGDEKALKEIAEQRSQLMSLKGNCEHGDTPFSECSYILNRISNPSFTDKRDENAISTNISELSAQAVETRKRLDVATESTKGAKKALDTEKRVRDQFQMRRDTAIHEKQRGDDLWEELDRWRKSEGSPESGYVLKAVRDDLDKLIKQLESKRTKLKILQQNQSDREKALSEQANKIAQALLSDEVFARFSSRDELRPFHLSMRGGEAYRVLEILLGDAVCMYNAATTNSALPAFLLHDCPREADMSIHLYSNYLLQLATMEDQLSPDGCLPPFQYILTTTSPPPNRLQKKQFMRLKLDPCSDDTLLFGKRFGLEQKTIARLR